MKDISFDNNFCCHIVLYIKSDYCKYCCNMKSSYCTVYEKAYVYTREKWLLYSVYVLCTCKNWLQHCPESNPNFRYTTGMKWKKNDTTWNIPQSYRVSRLPSYISCYIAENLNPLGQCVLNMQKRHKTIANSTVWTFDIRTILHCVSMWH